MSNEVNEKPTPNSAPSMGTPVTEEILAVPAKIKLAWGTGALGVAVLINGISMLVLFYMVGVLKIEPALAGAVIFTSKILDVLSDPVVGYWSDRIRSPIGRRRPFLVWGAVISAASLALVFTTPIFENELITAGYVFAALLIYTIGYTTFNVPYMAMPAEMTDSYHERSSIHSYRVVFVMIGSFIAGGLGNFFLEEMGRDEASSYAVLGLLGAAIIFLSMFITFLGTKEARFTRAGESFPDIRADLSAVMHNHHFLRLLTVKACQLLAFASTGAVMIFYITNSLQLDLKIMALFYVGVTVMSVVSTPVLVKISKRIGKRSTYIFAGISYVIYCLSWILAEPGEPIPYIIIRAMFVGLAAAGNILIAMSMLTDTIEYDATVTGNRREGTYTALYSFVEKITHAFGPLIIGVALSVAGFDKNLPSDEMQSPAVQQALLFGVAYLPAVLAILALMVLAGFKLDEAALKKVKAEQKPKTV
jgi:GPH family glycoside/pentoside/hexuronide:cation symporter